jgi:hypothetical protein
MVISKLKKCFPFTFNCVFINEFASFFQISIFITQNLTSLMSLQ